MGETYKQGTDVTTSYKNWLPLGFSGALLAKELHDVTGLADYDKDQRWYWGITTKQKDQVAVVPVTRSLDNFPVLRKAIESFYDASMFGHAQLFVTNPGYLGAWHKDGIDLHASINIPVYGTGLGFQSYIDWTEEHIAGVDYASSHTKHTLGMGALQKVSDRCVLDQMCLVRTDVWHRINNRQNTAHRVTLALRFKDNPTFEHLAEALKTKARL